MTVQKMGRLKKKLGCLFPCSGSTDQVVLNADDAAVPRGASASAAAVNGNGTRRKSSKRVTIREDSRIARAQSATSDILSMSSARSSVYFDAAGEGGSRDSLDDSLIDAEDFENLKIDGQYFFNAKDDKRLSQEAFEGIKMYPPLPTTAPDRVPISPISVTNMDTLLHTYQHSRDDIDAQKSQDEAEIGTNKAGIALEHQAQRLMTLEEATAEYMGESTNQLLKDLKIPNVREKGFPGELTEEELEAVKLFQSELRTRDPIYNQIVRSMSVVEKEAYALCRWLRARKFDVEKVFELLDEAKESYAKAHEEGFYPDLEKALGISRPVFLSQYPAVFAGNAKNGCPVLYLKLGQIQPEGIKCVVSLETVDRYFWNDVVHAFPPILKEGRNINPNFMRTENITVYDINGVSRSQITSDTFEMIKVGNRVMSSFPETLHCLLIINAPSWFGFVWSVVKKLIDPRTASKIEVFTSSKKGDERMRELIDNSQIPSCYNGGGPSLAESASGSGKESPNGAKSKMVVLNHLMLMTKKKPEQNYTFELEDAKQMTLTVYTRVKAGAHAALFRVGAGGNDTLVTEIDLSGEKDDWPYSRTLAAVAGPGSFKVKIKGKAVTGPQHFLVLGCS